MDKTHQSDSENYLGGTPVSLSPVAAEAALRESEERFHTLADNITQLAWMADSSGDIFWYNRRWFDFTGTTLPEVQGWGWHKVHHPDHVNRVIKKITEHFSSGELWEDTFPLRGKDGNYRWFLSRAVPIRDETGQVTRWFGTSTDINELLEAQEQFRLVADTLPQLVWSNQPDGYVDYFNKRWYEYTGATLEHSEGEGWSRFIHPEDLERTREVWQGSIAAESIYEIEYRIRRNDGVYCWFIGRALPLRDASGRIIRWFGTCTDIDDQRRAAEELKFREAHYRTVIDSIPAIGFVSTPERGCEYLNRLWSDYTGMTVEESLGAGYRDALHPDDRERTMEAWKTATQNRAPFEVEYRFRSKDGSYRWFLGRATPMVDERDNTLRYFGTLMDIEEQKRTEELLWQQQDEIAGLNVRLRRAMVETHHRVKNNLQMIAALIAMQRGNEADALIPGSVLDRLTQNVTALGIIHDILTGEAKGDGEAQSLSTKALLERLINALQQTNPGRRILASVEDTRLQGKRSTSMALAANEYISNALKHGSGDTLVTFHLDGGMAVLEVCDDGPGFPDGFDPITAANTGLELIESLIRFDLDGQTYYENREGGGARVRAIFPLANTGSSAE